MAHFRYTRFAIASICILTVILFLTPTQTYLRAPPAFEFPVEDGGRQRTLDDVIEEARRTNDKSVQEEASTLQEAADSYRRRRGRHPPPGFDKWFARARNSRAVIVESFFDQIYEDLEPFWGVKPSDIRDSLDTTQTTLRIRDGRVEGIPEEGFRDRIWGEMIEQSARDLPDMDMVFNLYDEPRVFVPWKEMDEMVTKASHQREEMMAQPLDSMSNRRSRWTAISEPYDPTGKWITEGKLWPYILDTCPPWKQENTVDQTPLDKSANWTTGKDLCSHHEWANLHGCLIKPASLSISTTLTPIFSAAKLHGSNDIIFPPAAYFEDSGMYTGKDASGEERKTTPWHKKKHGLVWRGKATGGAIDMSTFGVSHRQRLVSMLNSSDVSLRYNDSFYEFPTSDGTPEQEPRDEQALASWLDEIANAGLTDFLCPSESTDNVCEALSNRYEVVSGIPMKIQWNWKYLPDIDGNSLSGRFRAFVLSDSSPMKATIYKEWHDSRLTPWVHFIPLDVSLRDLWSTAAYFLGFKGVDGHDDKGEQIASEGRVWGEKVLRKEDMVLYVHRLLLEYGRVCDDERDRLGYTEDLR